MEFTRSLLTHVVNTHNSGSPLSSSLGSSYRPTVGQKNHDEQYFQVLLFDDVKQDDDQLKWILGKSKLVLGKKKSFLKLAIKNLPSNGVEIIPGFLNLDDPEDLAKYPTVRLCLQTRNLSQMMVHTWIDESDNNSCDDQSNKYEYQLEVKLIREILDKYNIVRETYLLKEDGTLETDACDVEAKFCQTWQKEPEDKTDEWAYLIKPDHTGYLTISLALFLCGQAYYKNPKTDKYCQIGDHVNGVKNGIFSTYEMIWDYATNLSWDTFYANVVDLAESSGIGQQKPPFATLTLGYPPRPEINDYNVTHAQMKEWVKAKAKYDPDKPLKEQLPFYPKNSSPEWDKAQFNNAVPPYPYLPLSSS